MSFPKFLGILTLVLFGLIGIAILLKEPGSEPANPFKIASDVIRSSVESDSLDTPNLPKEHPEMIPEHVQPKADLIASLFNRSYPRLPIVTTITYKSRVEWLPTRDAWLVDYASHYKTSRHFIARSLNNNRPVYDQQDVKSGDRFNVFNNERDIEFYLVVDASLCSLYLYYYDKGRDERVLLKDYRVGLGRIDHDSPSGYLTPYGIFSLGSRIATYGPESMGNYRGQKVKMCQIFGTRWIPFDREIGPTSHPAKGFGLHGAPFLDDKGGQLKENRESLGHYESDGCIRLAKEDIEEIYAIIVTRPSRIEIVPHFSNAHLPGKEAVIGDDFFH